MLHQKNLPFNNVVADGVASLTFERGMTYDGVLLKFGGTTFTYANVARLVFKLNGKIFYDLTGAQIKSINDDAGIAYDATMMPIHFTDPRAKTIGGELIGQIGTAQGVSSFTCELTTTGASANLTLESWSMLSAPKPLGPIRSFIPHPTTFDSAGKFPITLPYGPGAAHQLPRVHFFHANMTALNVKKNGLVIYEEMEATVNDYLRKAYGAVPQAGHYVYDPVMTHNMRDMLMTGNARSLQFETTVSAADSVNVVMEAVTMLGNL